MIVPDKNSTSPLYPDPPHLIVSVYSDQPEVVTFAKVCEAAEDIGCSPLGVVEVAPLDREFELVTDLGGAAEVLAGQDPMRVQHIVAGKDPRLRAVKAAFSHHKFGKVVVEYVLSLAGDLHPIALTVSASSLGFPERLWTGRQRRSAYVMADWTGTALEVASARCDALYGAIGVEYSLPTPRQFRDGKAKLPTEVFVSRRLLDGSSSVESGLRRAFAGGEVTDWANGTFLSGWAPYNSGKTTVDAREMVVRRAAELLSTVLP